MALFKIAKGNEFALPKTCVEGHAYLTSDTGKFFVDIHTSDEEFESHEQAVEQGYRIQLNALHSETADYADYAEEANLALSLQKLYFAETSESDEPGRWTATIPEMISLEEGDMIMLKLNTDGHFLYDSLTLTGKEFAGVPVTFEEKMVYAAYNTELQTNITKGNTILLIYRRNTHDDNFIAPDGCPSGNDGFILLRSTDYNYYDRQVEANNIRYAAEDIPRFKLVMADAAGQLHPLVQDIDGLKIVNQTWFRPELIWFYNYGKITLANEVVPAETLYNSGYVSYIENFKMNEDEDNMWDGYTYSAIYLKGTLDKDSGLFLLDNQNDSPAVLIPTDVSVDDMVLSNYFAEGAYYIYLGTLGTTSTRQFALAPNHPMYFFTGTDLTQVVARATKADILEGQNRTDTEKIQLDSNYLLKRLYDASSVSYELPINPDMWCKRTERVRLNGTLMFTYFWKNPELSCGRPYLMDSDREPFFGSDRYRKVDITKENAEDGTEEDITILPEYRHKIPPIISCIQNDDEFAYIEYADAEPLKGITFYASTKPKYPILLYVIDMK